MSSPASAARNTDLERVYRQYFRFVWRVARWMGAPSEYLEDVVQEVFLVVHRHLPGFRQTSSTPTWLYAITRKVVSTFRRTHSRHARRCEAYGEHMRDAQGADLHARTEAADEVLRRLDRLDEDRRAVFVACELAEMTAAETATSLGISLASVYSRLHSARKTLKEAK